MGKNKHCKYEHIWLSTNWFCYSSISGVQSFCSKSVTIFLLRQQDVNVSPCTRF